MNMKSLSMQSDCKNNLNSEWILKKESTELSFTKGKITKNTGELYFQSKLGLLRRKSHYFLNNEFLVTTNRYFNFENKDLSIKKLSDQKYQVVISRKQFQFIVIGSQKALKPWIDHLKLFTIQKNFDFKFAKLELLGKGSQGKVYKVRCFEDGKLYATKQFNKKKMGKKSFDNLLKELSILRKLDHKGITKLFETYETKKQIHLILECLEGGELLEKINAPTYQYNEQFVMNFALNLLHILDYVHQQGIIHRDLKPENLILRSSTDMSDFVIADFGLSDYFDSDSLLNDKCGTIGYIAPEVLQNLPYDQKVDIYSIGVILFILFTGELPFIGKNTEEIYFCNLDSKINTEILQKMDITEKAKRFVFLLLNENPQNRPTAQEALLNEWFDVPPFLTSKNIIHTKTNIPQRHQKHKFLSIKCTSPLWTSKRKDNDKHQGNFSDSSDDIIKEGNISENDDLSDLNKSSKELIQSPKQCQNYHFSNSKIRYLNETRNDRSEI